MPAVEIVEETHVFYLRYLKIKCWSVSELGILGPFHSPWR